MLEKVVYKKNHNKKIYNFRHNFISYDFVNKKIYRVKTNENEIISEEKGFEPMVHK